mmetsp:Transcript_24370/g.53351  ORF Transcript_24370/g.53351 Transcript_24370/m.53351 type:complete len:93 (+) Transcript_24370:942-1220(+)
MDFMQARKRPFSEPFSVILSKMTACCASECCSVESSSTPAGTAAAVVIVGGIVFDCETKEKNPVEEKTNTVTEPDNYSDPTPSQSTPPQWTI